MTALLHETRPLLRTRAEGRLVLRRDDIVFFSETPGRVRIEVTVRNHGDAPTGPTAASVMAAPLGAFVPWQPLLTLHVPALEPGGTAVLQAEAVRGSPRPLGPPDRVPPRRLLTALASNDAETPAPGAPSRALARVLPADLADLVGRGNPHFAGNLNVFIAGRAVERHLARALRVHPDRVNYAMFVIGSGPDAYAFHLRGDAVWEARLSDGTTAQTLAVDPRDAPAVPPSAWIEVTGTRLMFLVLQPPGHCGHGSVEVHVTQRSTRKQAVVEFDLDPQAAGPGCFVV